MRRGVIVWPLSILAAGCGGPQSAFRPLGEEAGRIATLFWGMLLGSTAIFVLVIGAALLAMAGDSFLRRELGRERAIVAGGIVLPIVVLSALLIVAFRLMALESERPDGDAVRIAVIGERWWWRVRYLEDDGSYTETANEIRIPVGRPVHLELTTADVIHSFWAPPLTGKLDMVPGHINTLELTATGTGVVRGQCAEYCGGAHALMAFYVVADAPESFSAWLSNERADAADDDEVGSALFVNSGCGGCHSVRGTEADGTIGPDLTHVGGRLSIGAGILRTSQAGFSSWIRFHQSLKPGNTMPPFGALSDAEYERLADYLMSLD